MMNTEFLAELGRAFVPKRFRPTLHKYLLKAGLDDVPYKFFGSLFFLTIFSTIITYFLFIHKSVAVRFNTFIVGIAAFSYIFFVALLVSVIIILIISFYLNIRIYNRTKVLESKLVDYLTLVSTNLKGGLSFEKSLWMSIKPDFGILAREIGLVSKKVMTGNDLSEALIEFSYKYDSPILKRTINLIIGELESGGQVVNVIDKNIENLRKTRLLKEEMAAATVTYMIFIGAIVMVIAPALFALSGQLLHIIISFSAKLGSSASAGTSSLPVSFGEVNIDPSAFRNFSMLALSTIGIFSAFIIAIIERGDIRSGLKYIPLFIIVSALMYFVMSGVLASTFGNFISV